MTESRERFLSTEQGRRVRRIGCILRLCAGRWVTINELQPHVPASKSLLRNWLGALVVEGLVRMRNRPHEIREDGNKVPGPHPREYRVSSRWSAL